MQFLTKDFTAARYKEILQLMFRRFQCADYDAVHRASGLAILRHDVDMSPQRALALASLESEESVRATYFFQLSSRFYSVFEKDVRRIVREIRAMGHRIGLHFDPDLYADGTEPMTSKLKYEAGVLSEIAGIDISVFSLHNPTLADPKEYTVTMVGGMTNATAPYFREAFTYCSDSNGVWRFRPLADVIRDPKVENLHVLLHPEWWQPTAMLPRERIQRCIDGRRIACEQYYDALLAENSRPNI
jgi:hypothetical protein